MKQPLLADGPLLLGAKATSAASRYGRFYSLSVPQMMADAGLDEAARRRIVARNPARLFHADATTPPSTGHEEQVTS